MRPGSELRRGRAQAGPAPAGRSSARPGVGSEQLPPPQPSAGPGCGARPRPPRPGWSPRAVLPRSRSRSAVTAEPRTRSRIPNSPPCIFNCSVHASPEEHQGFNILSSTRHGKRTERFAFTTDTAVALVSQLPPQPAPRSDTRHRRQPARVSFQYFNESLHLTLILIKE